MKTTAPNSQRCVCSISDKTSDSSNNLNDCYVRKKNPDCKAIGILGYTGQSILRRYILPRSGDIESDHEFAIKEIILIVHVVLLVDNSF